MKYLTSKASQMLTDTLESNGVIFRVEDTSKQAKTMKKTPR
jgi:hypothetical protein